MFYTMMMGGQAHYQNGLSEGWPPQLVGPGGEVKFTEQIWWATYALLPFDLLALPVMPTAIDVTNPIPTQPSRPVPTLDPRIGYVIGRGQLVPTINGLHAGSNTFTLSLQNKNPSETFNIWSVYDLIVTDDISGSVPYEFDNAAMFDAGFAKSVDAGQAVTITYILKSPIDLDAKVVNFKLPNISFIDYLNPPPLGDLGRGQIVTVVDAQSFSLPDLSWQATLP